MFGLVLLCSVVAMVASAPENYILNVTPACGATVNDSSMISIRTDMVDVAATGVCKSSTVDFTPSQNEVVHTLNIVTSETGASGECAFNKKTNVDVYTVTIEVSYGEPGAFIHTQQQTYLITCTYNSAGINIAESSSRLISEPYIQPKQIQDNMGRPSNATFSLQLLDVLDRPLIGSLQIGRMVRLLGEITGGTGAEPGVRVVSCAVIGNTAIFDVIRGGCGDGVVFSKTAGFITKGRKTYSPYFGAFKLAGGSSVQFSCNFTVCTQNCDGSSCTNERRKRDVEIPAISMLTLQDIEVVSPRFEVESQTCAGINVHKEGPLLLFGKPKYEEKSTSLIPVISISVVMVALVLLIGIAVMLMYLKTRSSPGEDYEGAVNVVKPAKKFGDTADVVGPYKKLDHIADVVMTTGRLKDFDESHQGMARQS